MSDERKLPVTGGSPEYRRAVLRAKRELALKQTRWAFLAAILVAATLVGLLLGLGLAALLGL